MAHSFDWPSGKGKGIGTCRLCGVTLRFVTAGPRGGQKREWRTPDGVIHKQGRGELEGEPPCLNGAVGPKATLSYASGLVELARKVPERFLVALSFSGAEREFVRAIAEAVERHLGASSVFFDEWFEFYIGGHDADVKLQRIYSAGCELAVVCVSAAYGSKAWTRAEHEAIRARLMQARAEEDPRQRDRVFPVRVGDGDVDGIPVNAIVPDVRGRTPQQVAQIIVDRLRFVMGSAGPGTADGGIAPVGTSRGAAAASVVPAARPMARYVAPPTPAYLNAEVQALSQQLERAQQRQQNLRGASIGTDEVDREILELRRKLRDGGQLRAGDALSDGRYLLVEQVGRGGFAVVWDAWDRAEQQHVAIKVLHHHLASDPQRRERFFRGARVMMDLKHPAVVRVLDPRGEDESFCYFVMELVPGGNLREAVLGNRVTAAHRLALILQVGEGLAEAHRQQLVHRDIKPANILLDEHGKAKLTDFDLVGAHDTTGGTRTGALGTVVYAAPECLDKPQDATARADVFGLGMTTIFCLVGHDLSMDTLVDRAGALAQLDCTESVRKALEKAVEWKQERRFADAAAMIGALRDALGSPAQSAARDEFAVGTATLGEALVGTADAARPAVDESNGQTANADAELQADVEVQEVQADVVVVAPTGTAREGTDDRMREVEKPLRSAVVPASSMRVANGSPVDPRSTNDDEAVLRIQQRPRWASASGKDHYGEWAECIVKGLQHRMRWIPPGTFLMGSPKADPGRYDDEEPQHEVTLTRGYWLGETPVTQALWVAVMGENPSGYRGERFGDLERPVECVSFEHCQRFLGLLNAQIAGLGARLPTEAEWERACRAGTTTATWVGELSDNTEAHELDPIAWYDANSGDNTHPVGRKAPNPYGLYDMLGNVWEWCADGMRKYTAAPMTDPVGGEQGLNRVIRGGSWYDGARLVRAAFRNLHSGDSGSARLGFRLAGGQSAPR